MSGRTRKTFIDSKTAHTENNLFVRVCEQHVSCQKLSKKSGKNFSNNNKLFPNALSPLSRYRLFERNVKSVGEGGLSCWSSNQVELFTQKHPFPPLILLNSFRN